MKTHIEMKIGKLLKSLRKDMPLNLAEVGYKIKMSVDTLSEMEAGRQHIPIHRIEQLCKIYGITLVEFFKRIAEMEVDNES